MVMLGDTTSKNLGVGSKMSQILQGPINDSPSQPKITLSPNQRRMPTEKVFKRKFEICYEDPKKRVSKINLVKQEGTVKDPEDPIFKILGERSIAYGKGLGGGGGKYIPGVKAPVNEKILP